MKEITMMAVKLPKDDLDEFKKKSNDKPYQRSITEALRYRKS